MTIHLHKNDLPAEIKFSDSIADAGLVSKLDWLEIRRDELDKKIWYGYAGLLLGIIIICDFIFNNGFIRELTKMVGSLGLLVILGMIVWMPFFFFKRKKIYDEYYSIKAAIEKRKLKTSNSINQNK